MQERFTWKEDINAEEWNTILSSMHGHPLQSATWGDSRKVADGIKDVKWAVFKNDIPLYLVRFEERRLFGLFKIAWVPRGPTVSHLGMELSLREDFFRRLRTKGFLICAISPWMKAKGEYNNDLSPRTIWIDLTVGKETVWNNLSKQCRYDIRRAKKSGIMIEKSKSPDDIHLFYDLCQSVSHSKGFALKGSAELMSHLLQHSTKSMEAYLFKAIYQEKFCGGAFVIRCGESVHYMWAAVDRAFAKLSIGEALQWEIIEWALSQNCKLYDLEGIDPKKNPGTYHFKKKMGGQEIILSDEQCFLLNTFLNKAANFLNLQKILNPFLLYRKYKRK